MKKQKKIAERYEKNYDCYEDFREKHLGFRVCKNSDVLLLSAGGKSDMRKEYNCIGQFIKTHRRALGLTQKELAEKTGISENSIQKYEQGTRIPKQFRLAKIAEVLNIPVEALTESKIDILHKKYPTSESEDAFINYLSSLNIIFCGICEDSIAPKDEPKVRFDFQKQKDKYGEISSELLIDLSKFEQFRFKIDSFVKDLLPLISEESQKRRR